MHLVSYVSTSVKNSRCEFLGLTAGSVPRPRVIIRRTTKAAATTTAAVAISSSGGAPRAHQLRGERTHASGENFKVETESGTRVKLRSGAGRPPSAMEETDAAAPFLLTGEPAVWLDTVFFPCAHVPLVTVIQFPPHLVGNNEICCL